MKKSISWSIALITTILLLVGSTFAWYVSTVIHTSDSIDIPSNGLVLDYQIDNNTSNSYTFTSSDIVFFDLDNAGEGYYLSTMAIMVTLKIQNKADASVDLSIAEKLIDNSLQLSVSSNTLTVTDSNSATICTVACTVSSGKVSTATSSDNTCVIDDDGLGILVKDSSTNVVLCYIDGLEISEGSISVTNANASIPYIKSIITTTQITASNIDAYKTKSVAQYCETNSYTNSVHLELAADDNDSSTTTDAATVYIYLFGVQPNDKASSKFLAGENTYYKYTLVMSGTTA